MQHGRDHVVRAHNHTLAVIARATQLCGKFFDGMVQLIRVILAPAMPVTTGVQRFVDWYRSFYRV